MKEFLDWAVNGNRYAPFVLPIEVSLGGCEIVSNPDLNRQILLSRMLYWLVEYGPKDPNYYTLPIIQPVRE